MAWSDAVGWNKRRGWNNPAAGGGGGSFATFDPTDFVVADTFGNACVALDATKLIATQDHNGVQAIITATRAISGKCHFEFLGATGGLEQAANKSGGYSGFMGGSTGLSWLPDGRVFLGFGVLATVATYVAGTDTIYIEVDTVAKLAYFGVNGGARSVGVDISGMTGTLYPAADLGQTAGNTCTANFGATAFVGPVTAGYGPIP